jgi:hypothetical protein
MNKVSADVEKINFCAADLCVYVVISDTIHKFLRERVDNKRASLTTTTLVHARQHRNSQRSRRRASDLDPQFEKHTQSQWEPPLASVITCGANTFYFYVPLHFCL